MSSLFNLSVYINILVLSKISKNKIFFDRNILSFTNIVHNFNITKEILTFFNKYFVTNDFCLIFIRNDNKL